MLTFCLLLVIAVLFSISGICADRRQYGAAIQAFGAAFTFLAMYVVALAVTVFRV